MNKEQGFTFCMDKKGGEKWLSIWWYFCLVVILGGTVLAAWNFLHISDVSELDAEILASKVYNCVVSDNLIVFDIQNKPDIFSICKIADFEKNNLGKDYFIGIRIYEIPGTGKEALLKKEYYYEPARYSHGNLRDRCINLEGIPVTQMPDCSYKTKKVYGKDGGEYIIRVIGGTNE
jgi:hypothetical protein